MGSLRVVYHTTVRSSYLKGPHPSLGFKGIANLISIVFIANNFRVIVSNFLEHGFGVSVLVPRSHEDTIFAMTTLVATLLCGFVLSCCLYLLERSINSSFCSIFRKQISEIQKKYYEDESKGGSLGSSTPYRARSWSSTTLRKRVSTNSLKVMQTYHEKVIDSLSTGSYPNARRPVTQAEADSELEPSSDNGISVSSIVGSDNSSLGLSGSSGCDRIVEDQMYSELDLPSGTESPLESALPMQVSTMDVQLVPALDFIDKSRYKMLQRFHITIVAVANCMTIVMAYITCQLGPYSPVRNLIILMSAVILVMKSISYTHIMGEIRSTYLSEMQMPAAMNRTESGRFTSLGKSILCMGSIADDEERSAILQYPNCISYRSFVRFLFYPTLCFQFNYPLKERTNWLRVLRYCVGMMACGAFMSLIYQRYIINVLETTFSYPDKRFLYLMLHLLERLLRLSIPTLYCWILMFVMYFHCFLTVFSEITKFDDELFYLDWWNAASIGEYWRKWNIPVHRFCSRHIYIPMRSAGFPRMMCTQLVFIISAAAHEYVVSGALRLGWTGIVFLGFILQAPLAQFTESRFVTKYPLVGNACFWVTFCFTGQPLAIMVFYYLWFVKISMTGQ